MKSGDTSDGEMSDISLIIGGNFDNGRGNVTAYATYRDIEGIAQSQRDHSACAVRSGLFCLGSATNEAGTFNFGSEDFLNDYFVNGNEFEEVTWPNAVLDPFDTKLQTIDLSATHS